MQAPYIHTKQKPVSVSEISVTHEGGVLCVTIQRTSIRLDYKACFTIAQWLRLRAKRAALFVGDDRKWFNATAPTDRMLEDADVKPFIVQRVLTRLRPVVAKLTGVRVSDIENRVELRVGNVSWTFKHETALQLSAWMRQHAKMAKREQCDTATYTGVAGILSE